MRQTKNLFALLLTIALLCSLLCACGSSAATARAYQSSDMAFPQEAYAEAEAPAADTDEMPVPMNKSFSLAGGVRTEAGAGAGEVSAATDFSKKIIYTANYMVETTDFDAAADALQSAVTQFGGFIENSGVYGNTSYDADGTVRIIDRNANYTLRIPAEKLDAFLLLAGEIGNVTSKNLSANNVTSQYTDLEARRDSLKAEQTRLLELMEKAESIDAIIALESKLTDVNYEIDSIARNLRNIDTDVTYSTVYLNLYEVRGYTKTVSVQRSLGERIADAFKSGWKNFVRGVENFLVFLSGSIFGIAVAAVVVFVVIRLILRAKKKKAAAKQTAEKPADDPPAEG